MRMSIIHLLSIITINCVAQNYGIEKKLIEQELNIPPIEESSYEVEIRLIADIQSSTQDNFVLIKNENGKWISQGFTFIIDPKDNSISIKKSYTERIEYESVVQLETLIGNNFSIAHNQEVITDKLIVEHEKSGNSFSVKDGTTFYLTIKSNDTIKRFSLHSPWSYSSKFPESHELKWYCDILDCIDRNTKVKIRG